MPSLADLLDTHRSSILEQLAERTQATLAHLPAILDEITQAVRAGGAPRDHLESQRSEAAAHGRQRLLAGADLSGVVREYGLLRNCVLEMAEATGAAIALREIRIFCDCISTATATSIAEFVSLRQRDLDAERNHLLGLFQQAPGFVCFLRGPDLVFELANTAYDQLVGHREVVGKSVREALPEVAGQGFFELLERVFATRETFVGRGMSIALQREPGTPPTEAVLDFIYQPIVGVDGSVSGILVQGHDVTEAKRQELERQAMERALRASEERYRTLFASIDDGFCLMQMILDPHGATVDYRFLETNAAFEGQTGLVNAVGKTASELVPDLDASWFQLYGRVAATGETTRFENHAPAMGRWFEVYASRVGDPALRQVALVFKDITARKRVEAERERLLAAESNARVEAEQAGRLRDEFLATVSHELRTPLSSILGWSQMLLADELSEDQRAKAIATIERNARAQGQLIEDLLDVSRILAGKLRLEVEPTDVRGVIEAALETVRPAAQAREIALAPSLNPGCSVLADPQRLQQVVWNLLSNSVKFTPRGGRIQIEVRSHAGSAEITIADTGQGIAAEFQPYVFDRFRQAQGGTTRPQGGLGLGLSIVREIVELHGGSVSVFSEGKDRGTRFTVRLPLASQQPRDLRRPVPPARAVADALACPPELRGLRVLLVDDDDDVRDLVQTMLETCGIAVRVAASAAEALRLFERERPDLIVSDVGMPGQDGYMLIEQIRQLPGGDVPAVALSAYARSQDRARAVLAGFDQHLSKPVEPFELYAVISALTRRGVA